MNRAINLPVAGDIHAQLAQGGSVAGAVSRCGATLSLNQRLDDLGNVSLIDRARVMQARHDRAQGKVGGRVHIDSPFGSLTPNVTEPAGESISGRGGAA